MLRRRRLRFLLRLEILQAEKQKNKDGGEDEHRARVLPAAATALLIRISYLCQTRSYLLFAELLCPDLAAFPYGNWVCGRE
jgi:hypothetical protein